MCVGTMVSRSVVITAAVCVTNPTVDGVGDHDKRPITIVTGTTYRHPRRGIRVPVTKILVPRLSDLTGHRGYLMQKSPALLLLKHRVPDAMVEIPPRALPVDWDDNEDRIYPVHKFLLQRTVRVQFLNIVKMSLWCEPLTIKFQKALTNIGYFGHFDKSGRICVKDPDRIAQPCHGMYGAPLVCRGQLVGTMMAPDAQWTNCTGFSNIFHLLTGRTIRPFMSCVSSLFEPDEQPTWNYMKNNLFEGVNQDEYDYVPAVYDKLQVRSDDDDSTDEVVGTEEEEQTQLPV